MAIDIACKKRPKDAKKPIDENGSQWLNQQNFEDLDVYKRQAPPLRNFSTI